MKILETPRLTAVSPSQCHFDDIFSLQSDPDVMQFSEHPFPRKESAVRASYNKVIAYYHKYKLGQMTILETTTGVFVGQAGLFHFAFDETQVDLELGCRLKRSFWNKGYATEICNAFLEWGFANLNVDRLVAVVHPKNQASQKLIPKIHMKYIGKVIQNDRLLDFFERTRG